MNKSNKSTLLKEPPKGKHASFLSLKCTFNPMYTEYCSTAFMCSHLLVLLAGGITPALLQCSQWRGYRTLGLTRLSTGGDT